MPKNTTIRNRVLLFIVLLTYRIMCQISLDLLTGFYDDFKLGISYWGKYIVILIMVLYAIAGQYLIKKVIQEKWMIGIILTLVILLIYAGSIVLWLIPIQMQIVSSFFTLMSRLECTFVPSLLLVYTILYLIYDKKINCKIIKQ